MRDSPLKTVGTIALRNLARHRVKTVITTVAVAVSVALYIAADAWLLGMNLDSRRNIVAYETGAAKLQSDAYFAKKDELPMYESFSGWEAIADALEAAGYDSAPRFVFSGTLYSRTGTAPILFNAVDPEREAALLRYPAYIEAGRFPEAGRAELVLGTVAADKLRVGIPRRPRAEEYRAEVYAAAADADEAAFIAGLYEERDGVMALRDDASAAEQERLWAILSRSGRMDVRVSTVIDMVAAPEAVGEERFEEDLLPSLDEAGRALALRSYEKDPVIGEYYLNTDDPEALAALLRAMTAADYSGAIRHVNQLIDATVVGIVNSPNPKTNGNVAFMPLDALQGETGLMLDGAVTELLIRASVASDTALPGKAERPETIRAALDTALAASGRAMPEGLSVRGWEAYAEDYLAAAAGDNISTRIMIVFLFVLSFIGIANTMLMAVLERTKEIGMMRALGMTDGQLLLSYAIEAGMIGLLGSLAGVALGCLINLPMVTYGVDFSAMSKEMGGDFGYRVAALFRSAWNPATIAITAVAATLLSALMALPPTLRALRMPVTESLRFE